jgi:hypothetical protein
MTRTNASASAQRPKRTPISGRNVLTVTGKEPGYVYRIVNDEGGRIGQFLDAGYEMVDGSAVTIGDRRVNNATAEGSKAQASVSSDGKKAFVMRIKEEYYREDQQAKQGQVNALEQTMKQNAKNASDYGDGLVLSKN